MQLGDLCTKLENFYNQPPSNLYTSLRRRTRVKEGMKVLLTGSESQHSVFKKIDTMDQQLWKHPGNV